MKHLLFATQLLLLCAVNSNAAEYTFRVLLPDGTPIERIGLQVEAESVRSTLGQNPGRAWGYSDEHGRIVVDVTLPDPHDTLIASFTPGGWFLKDGNEIAVAVRDRFIDTISKYGVPESYVFQPEQASGDSIAEIRLPASSIVRFRPKLAELPLGGVMVYRVGGDLTFGSITVRADDNGLVAVPIPKRQQSVIYIQRDAVMKRLVISPEDSLRDEIDAGEVVLDMPPTTAQVRIDAVRPGIRLNAVTLVSQDAGTILVYIVDASATNAAFSPTSDPNVDRTLLAVPPGEYYVLRHYPRPDRLTSYRVPDAIERIAAGEPPGIDHVKIEVKEGAVRKYAIDVDAETGGMTVQQVE